MNPDSVWKECLAGMRAGVSQESYKTWLEPTSLGFTGEREAVIFTPKGEIHAGFLEEKYSKDNGNYKQCPKCKSTME